MVMKAVPGEDGSAPGHDPGSRQDEGREKQEYRIRVRGTSVMLLAVRVCRTGPKGLLSAGRMDKGFEMYVWILNASRLETYYTPGRRCITQQGQVMTRGREGESGRT